jgi:hypothetical protein
LIDLLIVLHVSTQGFGEACIMSGPNILRPVLMSSVYPFISGGGLDAIRRARATLKVDCLLHEKATLPGSLALCDEFIRALVMSNLDFVRSGDLVLDLRNECSCFADLARLKYGSKLAVEIAKVAECYDSNAAHLLRFSATDTSSQFKTGMLDHLRSLLIKVKKREIRGLLESRIQHWENAERMFTLDDACALGARTHYAAHLRKVAHYYYCVIGGQVVQAAAQVPKALWQAANKGIPGMLQEEGPRDPLSLAHASVLEYFAIDLQQIDRLTPQQILELKNEGLIIQVRRELMNLVAQAQTQVWDGEIDPAVVGYTKELSSEIRRLVSERCSRERGREKWENRASRLLEESCGLFVPGLSVAKSAIKRFGAGLCKWTGMQRLDFSTTPFVDYQARLQSRIVETWT